MRYKINLNYNRDYILMPHACIDLLIILVNGTAGQQILAVMILKILLIKSDTGITKKLLIINRIKENKFRGK